MQHCAQIAQVRQHRLSRFAPSSAPQGQAHGSLPPQEAAAAQEVPATLMASATASSHHLMESARRLLTYSRRHAGRCGAQTPDRGAQARQTCAGLASGPLSALPPNNSSAYPDGTTKATRRSSGLSSMLRRTLPTRASPVSSNQRAWAISQVAAGGTPSAAACTGMAAGSKAPRDAGLPSVLSAGTLAQKLLALRVAEAGAERDGMHGDTVRGPPCDMENRAEAAGPQAPPPRRQGAAAAAKTGIAAWLCSPAGGEPCCSGQKERGGEPSCQYRVFKGMVALVDPALPAPEADRSDMVSNSHDVIASTTAVNDVEGLPDSCHNLLITFGHVLQCICCSETTHRCIHNRRTP